jgi:hypothetical protein
MEGSACGCTECVDTELGVSISPAREKISLPGLDGIIPYSYCNAGKPDCEIINADDIGLCPRIAIRGNGSQSRPGGSVKE